MAIGAEVGRVEAKLGGAGVFLVVDAVAINAGRHIGVVLVNQGLAVNTVEIFIINPGVAFGTGQRDGRARLIGRLSGVRVVTIGADGGIPITRGNFSGVNAVQRLLVHLFVTPFTGFILFQSIKAGGVGFERRVRIIAYIRMAVGTGKLLLAVDRGMKAILVNIQ